MQEQNHVIGETAGNIYRTLEKSGAMETASLQKEAGVTDAALFNHALGWLAREDKIDFQKKGRGWTISLVGAQAGGKDNSRIAV